MTQWLRVFSAFLRTQAPTLGGVQLTIIPALENMASSSSFWWHLQIPPPHTPLKMILKGIYILFDPECWTLDV